jgi:hypothetical protein
VILRPLAPLRGTEQCTLQCRELFRMTLCPLEPAPEDLFRTEWPDGSGVCHDRANTRQDGNDFLALAARIPLHIHTEAYPLDDANRALQDLAADRVTGAAVLVTG